MLDKHRVITRNDLLSNGCSSEHVPSLQHDNLLACLGEIRRLTKIRYTLRYREPLLNISSSNDQTTTEGISFSLPFMVLSLHFLTEERCEEMRIVFSQPSVHCVLRRRRWRRRRKRKASSPLRDDEETRAYWKWIRNIIYLSIRRSIKILTAFNEKFDNNVIVITM